MSKKTFKESMSGKGYYIALVLCAIAIGICGYMFFQNSNEPEPALSNQPEATVPVQGDHVAVGATEGTTDPTGTTGEGTDPTETTLPKDVKKVRPVDGQTIHGYAMDALSYNQTTRDWRTHDGIDIAAKAGTPVLAAMDGTVYTVYTDGTMGTTVVLRHAGGYVTTYASLSEENTVKPGETVTAGQTLGYVGASALLESALGEHVHFSVSCNGTPVDPEEFLG
ncbi:MAG: M23 family metallopeptidase [Ruminococcaceae bacterium]|nr:M23 family metallopeptidase [Oscillospiraceae bacterium]